MSLRVLLADESSTIKKVMQLALQDFDVEVKAVPVGLDVIEVTRAFRPDLIFADVLLSKRNGYEVSAELKADPGLRSIPIILMWSGFMELDQAKAQLSKADRRLEKPFDADTLRNMVRELVPKTQGNLISQFLNFPNLPDIQEEAKAEPAKTVQPAAPKTNAPEPAPPAAPANRRPPPPPPAEALPERSTRPQQIANMDLDEPEDFQSVPLPKLPEKPSSTRASKPAAETESWAQHDLGKFMIPVSEEDLTSEYDHASPDLAKSSIALSSGLEEVSLEDFGRTPLQHQIDLLANQALGTGSKLTSNLTSKLTSNLTAKMSDGMPNMSSVANLAKESALAAHSSMTPGTNLPSMTTISHERMEQLLREQVREILEGIAWKVLPDLAERIIREEIQKLMKDSEKI